jgi:hypothetical protein
MKNNSDAQHLTAPTLLDAADGVLELTAEQREHLHGCERCQFVFTVFVKREIDNPPSKKKAADNAAA